MATYYLTPGGSSNDGTQLNPWGYANFVSYTGRAVGPDPVPAAGDMIYVLGGAGTYTCGSDPSANADGVSGNPISLIGVTDFDNPETTWAFDDDKPYFDYTGTAGTSLLLDDYWRVANLKVKANDGTAAVDLGVNGNAYNLDIENTGAGAAFRAGAADMRLSCSRLKSASGDGLATSAIGHYSNLYIYDSTKGILNQNDRNAFFNCIVYNCTTGFDAQTEADTAVANCSFITGTTGITGNTAKDSQFVRNIISGFTNGATWTAEQISNLWAQNCWNNTTDRTKVTDGSPYDVDPEIVNAAGEDFRVKAATLRELELAGITIGARPSLWACNPLGGLRA